MTEIYIVYIIISWLLYTTIIIVYVDAHECQLSF